MNLTFVLPCSLTSLPLLFGFYRVFSWVNFSTSFLPSVLAFSVVVFESPRQQAHYFAFLCFPDCSPCYIFTDFPDSPVSPEVSLIWSLAQQMPKILQLPIQFALSYTISSNPHLHSTLPPGTSPVRSFLDKLQQMTLQAYISFQRIGYTLWFLNPVHIVPDFFL